MIRNLSIAAFVVTACSLLGPSEAQAQWGYMGYPQFYGRNVYTVYDQDRLPYFALHPPVYYSRAVPRTFGYSPFAYPGIVQTPEIAPAGPEMVVNPFMEQLPSAQGQGEQASPTIAPPAANPPTPAPKAGPLQGFKPPRSNSKFGSAPKSDKSAAAAPQSVAKPLRIMNPHVESRIVTTSARKLAQ